MKKTFILGFAWMLSMLLACGCGKSDSSTTTAAGTAAEALAEVSAPTKVETTTAPKAEPLDLRGLWISDERADNMYMVADIRDNGKIGVFFIMEGDKTPWTYWIGTYDAPDKDTKTYHYTKEIAKQKVFEVLGDCTITEATGCYTNEKGKRIIMDTLVATKILEEVPKDCQHETSYKLKEIFNQASILNVRNTCEIRYNNESPDIVRYIQMTMEEYDLGWEAAERVMNAGW